MPPALQVRAAIVGALVSALAAGCAFAKQEVVKPERPAIEAAPRQSELRPDCKPFLVEWWVQDKDGNLKLVGQQIVVSRDCKP